jgi:hypothetical protein
MRSHLSSLAAVFLIACGNNQLFQTDRMIGCYAEDSGKAPDIRVSKDSGRYRLAIREEDKWEVFPDSLRPAVPDELDDLFGDDTASVAESLIVPEGATGLFRLTRGATIGGSPVNTEYFAYIVLGGGPVYKVACP